MNDLTINNNLLIGNPTAIKELATKDHARILVASDSHGRSEILSNILSQFGPSCDAFCFCGDGLCDIAYIYEKAKEDETFKKLLPPVIAYVQGNCDPSSYPFDDSTELIAPPFQTITVNKQSIMLVHGHREGVTYGFEKYGLKIKFSETLPPIKAGLFGHTHIAEEVIENDIKFINPGSCSSPRGGQGKSFAILTVEKTFIDTAFLEITSMNNNSLTTKIWTPA